MKLSVLSKMMIQKYFLDYLYLNFLAFDYSDMEWREKLKPSKYTSIIRTKAILVFHLRQEFWEFRKRYSIKNLTKSVQLILVNFISIQITNIWVMAYAAFRCKWQIWTMFQWEMECFFIFPAWVKKSLLKQWLCLTNV